MKETLFVMGVVGAFFAIIAGIVVALSPTARQRDRTIMVSACAEAIRAGKWDKDSPDVCRKLIEEIAK